MAANLDQLRAALAEFDHKSPTILSEAEVRFGGEAGYVDTLIALAPDSETAVSSGATWLLKARLEVGKTLTEKQAADYLATFPSLEVWGAQLHACQSVQYLTIPKAQMKPLAEWSRNLLSHKRPFLRAWALDALCHLAAQHPAYKPAAEKALAKAAKDPAASVKARARRIEASQPL